MKELQETIYCFYLCMRGLCGIFFSLWLYDCMVFFSIRNHLRAQGPEERSMAAHSSMYFDSVYQNANLSLRFLWFSPHPYCLSVLGMCVLSWDILLSLSSVYDFILCSDLWSPLYQSQVTFFFIFIKAAAFSTLRSLLLHKQDNFIRIIPHPTGLSLEHWVPPWFMEDSLQWASLSFCSYHWATCSPRAGMAQGQDDHHSSPSQVHHRALPTQHGSEVDERK